MVAVVAGSGLGVQNTSGARIGSDAIVGDSAVGWLGSNVTVNAKNGNLIIQNMDEILTGKGPDSIFSRVDNSQVYTTGGEWREGSQRTITYTGTPNTAGSTVTRTDWDGSAMVYTWNATASAYTRPAVGDKITFASNTWTWTDQARQVTETFDYLNSGRIMTRKDTDLNALNYAYTNGKLTRVTSQSGDYTDLSYDANGNLSQLTTRKFDNTLLDSRVSYTYDQSNRLQTCTIDLTPTNTSDNSTVTYTYTYDGTSTRVASISESGTGNVVSFQYTSMDKYRVTQVQESGPNGVRTTNISYDTTNKITSITDPLLKVTQLTYDSNGNLTQIKYPPATATTPQQIVQYAYNANQDVISVTDAANRVTAYSYDSNHNLTQVRDAAGNTIDYIYDNNNQLLNEIHYLTPDPDGAGAGAASNPVVTRRVYDGEKHLRFVVDAMGFVTEYQYNAPGQLVSTIKYTSAAFDLSTKIKTDTLSETNMTSWIAGLSASDKSSVQRADATYDYRGNLYTVTQYSATDSSENGLTTSPYTTTTYVYDQYGLLQSKQVSGIGSQTYAYDGMGRLISSTDTANNLTIIGINDGTRTTTVTLANGLVKTSTYTAQGELASYVESGGDVVTETVSYKYDQLGRLRTTSFAAGGRDFIFYDDVGRKVGYMNANGALTEYKYDAANRLIATVKYDNPVSQTNINSLYDASGNPTAVTVVSVRPALTGYEQWTWNIYDAANRLVEAIDGYGDATVYSYDGDDRLTQTTQYATQIDDTTIAGFKTASPTSVTVPASSSSDRTMRYFYDAGGRKIGTLDGTGSYTETKYDQAGRVIETIGHANFATYSNGAVSVTASSVDRHNYFVYDGRGDIRYTLDANLRPTEYVYDNVDNVIRTIDYGAPIGPNGSYSLSYVQSQISTLNLAANAATRVTRCVYDSAGRKAFEINAGDAQGSYVTAYAYNNAGQVIKETKYATPYTLAGDPSLSDMQTWGTNHPSTDDRVTRQLFDMLGRLAYEVDAENYVTRHIYDLNDRLVQDIRYTDPAWPPVTDASTKASLDGQFVTTPPSAVIKNYSYDTVGNLVDSYDGENVRTHYVYDNFNQLYSSTVAYGTSDASTTVFNYYTNGRLAGRFSAYGTAEQTTEYFWYDGVGNEAWLQDARGAQTNRTFDAMGNMLTEVVKLDASTTATTTRQFDAFGSVVKLTDPRLNAGYFYYDKLGRLELQIDAEGYATGTTYNIGDQPVTTTRYYQQATGIGSVTTRPTLATHALDAITTITYDKLDRVTGTIDAEQYKNINGTVEFAHEDYTLNAFGDRERVRNRFGGTTINIFDKRGLLKQETLPVGSTDKDGNVLSTAIVNKFYYDERGNRKQMIEAYGLPEQRTTNYVYDKNNRLTSKTGDVVQVIGQDAKIQGNIAPTENWVYDKRGNIIGSSDPNGALTLSYYDHNNRKIAEVSPTGTLSTWAYDGNGNVTAARVYGDIVQVYTNNSLIGYLPNDPSSPAAMVCRVYDIALGRMPNTSEIINWVWRMTNTYASYAQPAAEAWPVIDPYGEKMNQLEGIFTEFVTNPEFLARMGTPDTNTNFITKLYQWGFHRDPTSQETTNWLNAFASGWTRAGMLAVLCEHNDHRSITKPLIAQAFAGGTQPAPYDANNYRETLYTYDKNNRLTDTRVQNVRTGYFNGTNYQTQVQTVGKHTVYDAAGNIIRQSDAVYDVNGVITSEANYTYNYYDKDGRRIAQADPNNYLTVWYYDSEGNVLSETRYANLMNITPTTSTTLAQLQASVGTQSHDRTTTFTYDRNGRRKTETRLAVDTSSVDSNGGKVDATVNVTIGYTYNGLGEVTSKTEANGDLHEWQYDAMGRQIADIGAAFADYLGSTSNNPDGMDRTTTRTSYDGLNNVTRTSTADLADSLPAARITKYTYGAGGRLFLINNPDGFQIEHYYDAAGQLSAQAYAHLLSSGGWASDLQSYRYDAAGRQIGHTTGNWNGSGWNFSGVVDQTRYNAYGEVTGRGTNSYQEFFDYDNAGHVWRSNTGDGALKFFIYDQNGNQTCQIATTGIDLSSWTAIDNAINSVTNSGAFTIGSQYVGGVAITLQTYDGRNGLLRVRQPFRETTNVGSNFTSLVSGKDYNAFEEVVSEFDNRGNTTWYDYNTMGRMVTKTMPSVSVTGEDGAISNVTPVEHYWYDTAGRMVAVMDANGNVTKRTLLAGSGINGEDIKVLKEFHADGGVFETRYDAFRDARWIMNELVGNQIAQGVPQSTWELHVEKRSYDGMGRLTEVDRPINTNGTTTTTDDYGLIDKYEYDGLGRRIEHWIEQTGVATISGIGNYVERTDYDTLNRVTTQVDMGGDTTTHSYSWIPTAHTNYLGVGGWREDITNAAGKTAWNLHDIFGHMVDSQDYGGHNFDYTYNFAGWLTSKTSANGENISYNYYNSGKLSQIVSSNPNYQSYTNTVTSSYKYDIDGNRTFEGYVATGTTYSYNQTTQQLVTTTYNTPYESAVASYDALNRLTGINDAASTAPMSVAYEYDKVGNVRRVKSTRRTLDNQGAVSSTSATDDYWYKYDSMNRMTRVKGMLVGTNGSGARVTGDAARGIGAIQRDDMARAGVDLEYNAAGQRTASVKSVEEHTLGFPPMPYVTENREIYTYTDDGYLATTSISSGTGASGSLGAVTPPPAPMTGTLRVKNSRDALGRVTLYQEYQANGTTVQYSRQSTYNTKSQVTDDVVNLIDSNNDTWTYSTHYDFSNETAVGNGNWTGAYMGGVVTHQLQTVKKNNIVQASKGNETKNTYSWWDGAQQATTSFDNDTSSSTNNPFVSTYYYDTSGHVTTVSIQDGRTRTVNYITDSYGQVMNRDEQNQNGAGNPRDIYYYFDGLRIGQISNNGTDNVDYATALNQRNAAPTNGNFRNGAVVASAYADFDQSYDAIDPANSGEAGAATRYTVQDGDTLQSIASQLWGDSTYWYVIADANGLSGTESLQAGTTLTIPNTVHNIHNNSDTFRVYDPNQAIGDTSPTSPKPPKHHHGCGVFGQIIATIVAVAASYFLGPVVGNLVSQGFNNLIGVQHGFSFKSLGMSVVAATVSGALNGAFDSIKNTFVQGFLQGATANALTQGIGVATGLQNNFNWVGVAAAGVTSGVTDWTSSRLPGGATVSSGAGFGNTLLSGMAGAIAGAGARSLLTGTDFGDNLEAVLPDVIASTVGLKLAKSLAGEGGSFFDRIFAPKSASDSNKPSASDSSGATTSGNSAAQRANAEIDARQSQAKAQQESSTQAADEIVVIASRQSLYDEARLGDADFRFIDQMANARGWDPREENAYIHNYVAEHQPGYSLAQFGSDLSHAGHEALSYGKDIMHGAYNAAVGTVSTFGDVALQVFDPGAAYRSGATARNSQRFAYVASGRAFVDAAHSAAYTVDQLFTYDNAHPLFEAAGGLAIGVVGGNLSSRIGGTISAAETTGPRIIEGIDARTLTRSHSIEGTRSIKTVDQMSYIMRNDGYAFDPIDVIEHDGGMIIVDGHHRAAAAIRTNTPVNVNVVGPDQFPMGSGGWQSIDEVIQSSQTARPNRLNPPGRRR